MKRSPEPLSWLPFGAGGMLAALLAPGLVLVTGLLGPLGWLPAQALAYPRLLALAQHPLGKLALLAVVGLFLLHGSHRVVSTLHDFGLPAGPLVKWGAFAACWAATAATALVLWRIGF